MFDERRSYRSGYDSDHIRSPRLVLGCSMRSARVSIEFDPPKLALRSPGTRVRSPGEQDDG